MSAVGIVGLIILLLIKNCVSFNVYSNACEDYNDYVIRYRSRRCYYNPDVLSNTPTIIVRNGYPLQTFTVTTRDGYVLTIFRIPPRNSHASRKPVFLMHGIFLNNSVWVQLRNRSLAFNLADRGYDVWLGTIRGSSFANSHTRYNISSKEYWNFNLDSLAYFDIGAQLKFIAQKTKKHITYIGFSMGSTLSFLYAAGYPSEAKNLLSGIVALAPVLYVNDIQLLKGFKKIAAPIERELLRYKKYGTFYEHYVNKLLVKICSTSPNFCITLLEMFAGKLSAQFLPDELLLFFSNCPSGTSFQVLKHYIQLSKSVYVHRYDYGRVRNLKYYHLSEPRIYDLRYIKLPVYLLYGRNDIVATEKNVKRLYEELGSAQKRLIHIPKSDKVTPFTHLDFITAEDIHQNLYIDVFRILKELH